jgi:hypothetical protein
MLRRLIGNRMARGQCLTEVFVDVQHLCLREEAVKSNREVRGAIDMCRNVRDAETLQTTI